MSAERDADRIVRSWLEEGVTTLPDRVLDAVLDQVPATPQRRFTWWPARRQPSMNSIVKFGLAAALVAAAVVLGFNYLVYQNVGGPGIGDPSPTPSATPAVLPVEGIVPAGTYVVTPFTGERTGICSGQAGCIEDPADDSISVTLSVPDGWSMSELGGIWISENAPPDGAMLIFRRGGWLFDDPCRTFDSQPSIQVGPSVDDFANALADHPLLNVTTPVAATLGGYSGTYVDVQAPSSIDECTQEYRLWEPNIYAQGPDQRWHLWILDVDGVRVVVETMDYPTTSQQHQSELQAMVSSIQIEP